MKYHQVDLANEWSFVSEIQLVFKDEQQAAAFESKLRISKSKVFKYTRLGVGSAGTMTVIAKSADIASEYLKVMLMFIADEISGNTACHVIVGRVFQVLESHVATDGGE